LVHRIPVGVLGASGYAGRELCSFIASHPRLSLAFATAHERRGERIRFGETEVELVATDDAPLQTAELVFSALPHGASGAWVGRVRGEGVRAVDLSSDLRPGHTSEAIPYGLTELTRDTLRGAEVIANPGCYATAVLLGLAPLLVSGICAPGSAVTINAASGVTGAGNAPRSDLLYGEVAENFRAYAVANEHRHLPEMRAMVDALHGDVDLVFTPHLLPVARGILATIAVPVTAEPPDALAIWRSHYAAEPFIEVSTELPALKDVVRRNVARISARSVSGTRDPMLLVFVAIDNLVKGAAGQAVQNANLSLGLAETLGLPA
jgi:N-acetyl-gamma-glutamyl-phosphate reductase